MAASPRSSVRTCEIGESGSTEDADLPEPLLDAEPKEEQRQEQRRGHEKETEVGKVLAEVGGSLGRRERVPANISDGQPAGLWWQERPHRCTQSIGRFNRVGLQRARQTAPMSPSPKRVATVRVHVSKAMKALGSRSILFPVRFVLRSHSRQIDRKWRIPVGQTVGFGDPGILRAPDDDRRRGPR